MNHSKLSVRTLTMLALLTAMSIIFARVLTVSTGFLRFNLGALPTHLAAVWFGPAGGFAVGAVADLIGGTLSGYSINPLITHTGWASGGLGGHQLAGTPHFLWIPVAGAGGPHPQRHRAERGQHRAGPHPAGE